jgi:hypothetical protein
MALYSGPGYITYRGVPVLQSSLINVELDTANKDVDTMLLGRAGHSRGSKKFTITIENPIPKAGFEIDWMGLALVQGEVELGFVLAGKTWNYIGDIRTSGLKSGVDTANSQTLSYHCRLVGTV